MKPPTNPTDNPKTDFRDDVIPDRDQLMQLYGILGWTAYTDHPEKLEKAVQSSSYVATAWSDGKLIGLARTLSDETTIMYLQDILVVPVYQRSGIGRKLLEMCLKRYEHVRQRVLLTDDRPQQKAFYESLGFTNTKDFKQVKLNCFVRF